MTTDIQTIASSVGIDHAGGIERLAGDLIDDEEFEWDDHVGPAAVVYVVARGVSYPVSAAEIAAQVDGIEGADVSADAERIEQHLGVEYSASQNVMGYVGRYVDALGFEDENKMVARQIGAILEGDIWDEDAEVNDYTVEELIGGRKDPAVSAAALIYYVSHLSGNTRRLSQEEVSEVSNRTARGIRNRVDEIKETVGVEIHPDRYTVEEVMSEVIECVDAKDKLGSDEYFRARDIVFNRYEDEEEGVCRDAGAVGAAAVYLACQRDSESASYSMESLARVVGVDVATVSRAKDELEEGQVEA